MDRAFEISYISNLCQNLRNILNDLRDQISKLESAAASAEAAVVSVPSDVREESVSGCASSLRSILSRIDLDTFNSKIENCETRTLQLIPLADAGYHEQLDALLGQIRGIRSSLESVNAFLGGASFSVSDHDFRLAYSDVRKNLRKQIGDTGNAVEKVLANVKGIEKHSACFSKDPVNLSTGNFIYDKTDIEIPGVEPFVFRRFYNSVNDRVGSLGRDWNHSFELAIYRENGEIVLVREDGKEEIYVENSDRKLVSLFHSSGTLSYSPCGYMYETRDKTAFYFNREGRYEKCVSFGGIVTALEYDGKSGKLSRITRDTGEFFTLAYDAAGFLENVADHTGRTVRYKVVGSRLDEVRNVAGSITRYDYSDNGKISSVINAVGTAGVQNEYDEQHRIIRQEFPDGSSMSYDYNDAKKEVTLTERNGSKVTYVHDDLYRDIRHVYADGEERFEYNKLNQKTLVIDKLGNKTQLAYDGKGNLTRVIDALGNKTEIQYNDDSQLVSVFVNGEEKERYRYDNSGNLTERRDALGYTYKMDYRRKRLPEKISQPDGNVFFLRYDDRGNILSIEDVNGGRTSFTYDALNRVRSTTDANGNMTAYEYDSRDNITKVVNAEGKERRYTYNALGKVTEFADFNGGTIKREYNAINKVSRVIDPLGRETCLAYDAMWNVSKVTDPKGGITRYLYDSNNRLNEVINANGGSVSYTYDAVGNRTSVQDEEGNRKLLSYDALGRLVSVTESDGLIYKYTYDTEGNITEIKNSCGGFVSMKYNKNGWLTEEENEAGEKRIYTYTGIGKVESVTDEAGLVTRFAYEPGGKIREKTYPDSCTESYQYDAVGNLIEAADRYGYLYHYSYDCLNRLTAVEGCDGAMQRIEYDPVGNVTAIVDALENRTKYEYSLSGKLTGVVDALGNRTEYGYDPNDQLVEIRQYGEFSGEASDKHCQITKYERDLLDRVTKVIDPLGQIESYAYDKKGQLTQKIDKEGYLTSYAYTEKGDVGKIQYEDGREVKFSYNPLRQLQEMEDWLGVTRITTDSKGRALKVVMPDGKEVQYSYDVSGRRTSLTYPDGKEALYEYDDYGRLKSLSSVGRTVTYEYDEQGLLSEKNYPNGIRSRYEFDERGQIINLIHEDSEGIIDSYVYNYDLLGNKIGIDKYRRNLKEESGSYAYGYDSLGRLVSAAKDGLELRRYEYDAFGNRTLLAEKNRITRYSYNALNQLMVRADEDVLADYRYDKRGNLSAILENGRIKNEYIYGAINRLEEASNGKGEAARYIYNGLGNRVGKEIGKKTEDEYGSKCRNMISTTGFDRKDSEHDPVRELERNIFVPISKIEYMIDLTREYYNLLQRGENGIRQTYFWANNVSSMINGSGEFDVYLEDELGSPLRLAREDGKMIDSYGYDEFGGDIYGNQGVVHPFGYTGYQHDRIADSYFAQAREYRKEEGRFSGLDLAGSVIICPFFLNRYIYCWNTPLNMVDYNGAWAEWFENAAKVVTVVGAVVAVGTIIVTAPASVPLAIAAGAVTAGVISGFANERNGGSYFNGFVGGGIAGSIQTVLSLSFGPIGTIVGGAGNGVGSALTDMLDNLDGTVSKKKTEEEIFASSVNNALVGMTFSIPAAYIQGAIYGFNANNYGIDITPEIINETAVKLMNLKTNDAELLMQLFGNVDNALIAFGNFDVKRFVEEHFIQYNNYSGGEPCGI